MIQDEVKDLQKNINEVFSQMSTTRRILSTMNVDRVKVDRAILQKLKKDVKENQRVSYSSMSDIPVRVVEVFVAGLKELVACYRNALETQSQRVFDELMTQDDTPKGSNNAQKNKQKKKKQPAVDVNNLQVPNSAAQAVSKLISDFEVSCPITLELFEDPVKAADGHVYERQNIELWFQKHSTSPMTNLPMESFLLEKDVEMTEKVQRYLSCRQSA